MSIFSFQFLIHCLWYNECPNVNITFGNFPFNWFKLFAWQICGMDMSLQFDKFNQKNQKKCMFIYEKLKTG